MVGNQFLKDFRIRDLTIDITLFKGEGEGRSIQIFQAEVSGCGLHGYGTPRTFGGVNLLDWGWKLVP